VLAALDAPPEDTIIANDSVATFGRAQDLMTNEPGRYPRRRALLQRSRRALAPRLVRLIRRNGKPMFNPNLVERRALARRVLCFGGIFVVFNNHRLACRGMPPSRLAVVDRDVANARSTLRCWRRR
jgi:hypothetical protein